MTAYHIQEMSGLRVRGCLLGIGTDRSVGYLAKLRFRFFICKSFFDLLYATSRAIPTRIQKQLQITPTEIVSAIKSIFYCLRIYSLGVIPTFFLNTRKKEARLLNPLCCAIDSTVYRLISPAATRLLNSSIRKSYK